MKHPLPVQGPAAEAADDPRLLPESELLSLSRSESQYQRLRLLLREACQYHAQASLGLTLQRLSRALGEAPLLEADFPE